MGVQRTTALVIGVVLTLVGIIGFFTGDRVLIFDVNSLHNWVHLLSGILGIVAASYAAGAYSSTYNRGFGIVYLLVTILGFIAPSAMRSLLNINGADNVLHIVLALVLLGVGYGVSKNG